MGRGYAAPCESIFWGCCEEALISFLDLNKQHKPEGGGGGSSGTQSANTHAPWQPQKSLAGSGPPHTGLERQGESSVARDLGKGKHPATCPSFPGI